jgi:phage baseplate assembly protein W
MANHDFKNLQHKLDVNVGSPVFARPELRRTHPLTAPGKTVASPVFVGPILRKVLVAVGETVGAPSFGTPLFGKYALVANSMTVGSPALAAAVYTRKIAFPLATDIAVGALAVGQPLLVRFISPFRLYTAAPVFAVPQFGRVIHAVNLSVGTIFWGEAPPIGENFLRTLPPAQSLWTVPVAFDRPALTRIVNFVDTPPLRIGAPYLSDPHITTIFPGGGDMRGLPAEPTGARPFYREVNAIWPDLLNQRAVISPARNGVNRVDGKMLQGWEHVEQSMQVIFATPFHERILRRWVGSYVPYILGETYVQRIVTRFFWAIAVSIDLWEPNYRIKKVAYMGDALETWSPQMFDAVNEFRLGHGIFRTEGVYRPRAHLGDITPYQQSAIAIVGRGTDVWDPALGTR